MKRRETYQTETRCDMELNKLGLNKLELNTQKTDSNHRKDVVAVEQDKKNEEEQQKDEEEIKNLGEIQAKTVTSAKSLVTEVIAVLSLLQLGKLLLRKLCL